METDLLDIWKDWSIENFDANGAHIREQHLLNEDEVNEKIKEKKNVGVFFSQELAEKALHKAFNNAIIKNRVNCWANSPVYKKQPRLVISVPADDKVGYMYQVKDEKSVLYKECDCICMVFMKNKDKTEEPFYLYSAYPETEKKCVVL